MIAAEAQQPQGNEAQAQQAAPEQRNKRPEDTSQKSAPPPPAATETPQPEAPQSEQAQTAQDVQQQRAAATEPQAANDYADIIAGTKKSTDHLQALKSLYQKPQQKNFQQPAQPEIPPQQAQQNGANFATSPETPEQSKQTEAQAPGPAMYVAGEGTEIAPTATVGSGTDIGSRGSVGEKTNVGTDVVIGNATNIGSNVTIGNDTIIGNRSDIEDNATIGEGVVISNDVEVQEGANVGADSTLGPRSTVEAFATLPENTTVEAGSTVYYDASVKPTATDPTVSAPAPVTNAPVGTETPAQPQTGTGGLEPTATTPTMTGPVATAAPETNTPATDTADPLTADPIVADPAALPADEVQPTMPESEIESLKYSIEDRVGSESNKGNLMIAADAMTFQSVRDTDVNGALDTIEGDLLDVQNQMELFANDLNGVNRDIVRLLDAGVPAEELTDYINRAEGAMKVATTNLQDTTPIETIWNNVERLDSIKDAEDRQAEADRLIAILGIVGGIATGLMSAGALAGTVAKSALNGKKVAAEAAMNGVQFGPLTQAQSYGKTIDSVSSFIDTTSVGSYGSDVAFWQTRKVYMQMQTLDPELPDMTDVELADYMSNNFMDSNNVGEDLFAERVEMESIKQLIAMDVADNPNSGYGRPTMKDILPTIPTTLPQDHRMYLAHNELKKANAAYDADPNFGSHKAYDDLFTNIVDDADFQAASENIANIGANMTLGKITADYREGYMPWYEPETISKTRGGRGGPRQYTVDVDAGSAQSRQLSEIINELGFTASTETEVTKSGPKTSHKSYDYHINVTDGSNGIGFSNVGLDTLRFDDMGDTSDLELIWNR